MQRKTKFSFRWRRGHIKNEIIAVTKAVTLGYDTRSKLLAVLPQFSTNRIALAIDALIAADMVENNIGVLTIHPDMGIVFELVRQDDLVLPLNVEDAKAPGVSRIIVNELGCKNPAGVQSLLKVNIKES